jgi:hypothetical protein
VAAAARLTAGVGADDQGAGQRGPGRGGELWLRLSIAGNATVIAVYVASRTVGLPFGPDLHHAESVGALDVVSCVLEFGLIVGCAALLWRPGHGMKAVGLLPATPAS